jgi:hypothetical protein
MFRLPVMLSLVMILAGCGSTGTEVVQVLKPAALPLSIDPAFQFRKVKTFLKDPATYKPATDPMIVFERKRADFGAVTHNEMRERDGNYYTFFWRADEEADITVRFEYRQANLGPYVMAKESTYPNARGSYATHFQVTGAAHQTEGPVNQWRALLIRDGRVVALTQSYQWN